MNIKNFVGLFVLAISLLFLVSSVSAQTFATINYVEADSVFLVKDSVFGVEAGQTLDLRVVFMALADEENVRVTARVLGEPGLYEATERFDVLSDRTYSKMLRLDLPSDIDRDENFILEVRVESQSLIGDELRATFEVQRKNYALEFLSVESPSRISAGEVLPIEVIVEIRGRHVAEDTFVIASIQALRI